MQLFAEKVIKLWNEWELRAIVIISLGLQSILILMGSWRKQSSSNKLRIVLWLAYLSADSVATISLGVLSSTQEDSKGDSAQPNNFILTAFWAPFLLMHLGGPDTITAYSLEDNELWLRHLLGLVSQVLLVLYVFFKVWSSKVLNFLAIPIFIVGVIKFGERTWVLRSASREHFKDSMLPHPDPGPNYARYMEEYSSKKDEGFKVESGTFTDEATEVGDLSHSPAAVVVENLDDSQAAVSGGVLCHSHGTIAVEGTQNDSVNIIHAYNFFSTFKRLCADLILSFHDIKSSNSFFQDIESEQAFKVIEHELGFIYDMFYTKAILVYSRLGVILRCITVSFTVCVFLAFLLITEKREYKGVDVAITYILLVGGIFLEIYAIVILLSSDWTSLWVSKHENVVVNLLHRAVLSVPFVQSKRWSNTLAQYNLITFCLKARPAKCIFIKKDFFINQLLEKHRYTDFNKDVSEVTQLIFEQLKEKSMVASKFEASKRKELCARRGERVLEEAKCLKQLGWAINGVEFDESILLWHIATDLCYYYDLNRGMNPESSNCRASRLLSNYMLYLLVVCPFMLPNGIGQIRFTDTCAEAEEFFTERNISKSNENNACTKLYEVCTDILPSKVKGDRSKSVLFDGCRLAKALQSMESERQWPKNKKWELISHVWVEMLSYAANQCRWSDHAQQLRRGGELLTHVWLLMAHLGLTEQFQISEGHVRAKLIVE